MSITQRNNTQISGSGSSDLPACDVDMHMHMHRTMPGSTPHRIENVGHRAHSSSPGASAAASSALLRPMSL